MAAPSLESLIREYAKQGNLNHISLSVDAEDGSVYCALFRDTYGHAPYRYVKGTDPVDALKTALQSTVHHKMQAKARSEAKVTPKAEPKPASKRRERADDDIL